MLRDILKLFSKLIALSTFKFFYRFPIIELPSYDVNRANVRYYFYLVCHWISVEKWIKQLGYLTNGRESLIMHILIFRWNLNRILNWIYVDDKVMIICVLYWLRESGDLPAVLRLHKPLSDPRRSLLLPLIPRELLPLTVIISRRWSDNVYKRFTRVYAIQEQIGASNIVKREWF